MKTLSRSCPVCRSERIAYEPARLLQSLQREPAVLQEWLYLPFGKEETPSPKILIVIIASPVASCHVYTYAAFSDFR